MYYIQPYSEIHRRAVKAIGFDTFDVSVRPGLISALHEASPHSLILQKNDEVVGFALLSYKSPHRGLPKGLELAFLGIHEDHQGMGLGSEMLKHILSLNFQHFWLNVSYTNPDAQRLYERYGFCRWRFIGNKAEGGIMMGYSKQLRQGLGQRQRIQKSKNMSV
jgi:ribosomal protein S18 acetylase RimI-like enzyme